jgi:amino acid transporter
MSKSEKMKQFFSVGDDVVKESGDNTMDVQVGVITDNADALQRRLGNRQIQLIAIGGSIGTALFVRLE